ncbi:MAG0490 family ComEA-like DNA-binding protein [Mycoplasmopsis pulmonis]|uniref:MAG0490 family ComEA-like DNA-binding protein n=1 Tax=Mycoplasmopsis pulmonis TaxID=2107 RepID=UPI001004F85F|nr:hypothetical protein [Mycoplasmopsis pulmonis]VEU68224.1 Uncharacterised protein [Mycoplasmopsis pulmonis]
MSLKRLKKILSKLKDEIMIKSKWKKLLLVSALVVVLASFFIYSFSVNNSKTTIEKSDKITITLKGAFKYPGIKLVKRQASLRTIFKEAGLMTNADLEGINLESSAIENKVYKIQLKSNVEKIRWDQITQELLKSWSIKSNIIEKLIKLKDTGAKVSWKEIDSINGIGPITLNILKKNIQL